MTTSQMIVLASRPHGAPTSDNFRLETRELPALSDGELLVRNTVMSVDPYMRGRMNDVKSYVPPFQIDEPLDGGAVGEVVESRAEGFAEGDLVLHGLGWRDMAVVPAKAARKVSTKRRWRAGVAVRLPGRARHARHHGVRRAHARR